MKLVNLAYNTWVSLMSYDFETHPKTHPKFNGFKSDSEQKNDLKYSKIFMVSLMSLIITLYTCAHAHAHACLRTEINSRNSSNSPELNHLVKLTKLTKQKTGR